MIPFNFIVPPSSHTALNRNWIILDSGATAHIFCNKNLLSDVVEVAGSVLETRCNAGFVSTHTSGVFCYGGFSFRPVWYVDNGVANILSLSRLEEEFDVRLCKSGFFLRDKMENQIVFNRQPNGLYIFNCSSTNCLSGIGTILLLIIYNEPSLHVTYNGLIHTDIRTIP